MRILALDVGTKTIGVAISDELGIIANPYTTVNRVGIRKDTGKIIDIIKKEGCESVVIGFPFTFDGKESEMTQLVQEFKKMLENKLRSSGMSKIRIEYEDERFTTAMAEKVLIEADMKRAKRKEVIDKQAAVIILQSYLERRR